MRLTSELQCQTCREHPATFLATLDGEAWVACVRCREQAVRKESAATYEPIGFVEAHGRRDAA